MTDIQERISLEKHLSFVIGSAISLSGLEPAWLDPRALKRAYYRRAKELHPDRAAGLGLDSGIMTEKFRSLQNAYESVCLALDAGRLAELIRESGYSRPVRGKSASKAPAPNQSGSPKTATAAAGSSPYNSTTASRSTAQSATNNSATRNSATKPSGKPAGNRTAHAEPRPSHDEAGASHAGPRSANIVPKRVFFAGAIPDTQLRLAEWLYYTRKIDFDTLIDSLVWQYTVRPKIGSIARSLGFIDRAGVSIVMTRRRVGERFCEAAVRMGYLGPFERSIVLGRQRLMNQPIGSYFVERFIINKVDIDESLRAMWAHNLRIRARTMV